MATTRQNRLALDENVLKQAGKDVDTGKNPVFTLAAPYVLTAAHVVDGTVASIADWASVRLQVTSQCNQDGDRYLDRTQSTLNPTLTQNQWLAGTAGHAVFSFTAQDMNLALYACDGGPLYFVVTVTRVDGQVVVLGTGTINVERAHQTGTSLELAKAGDSFPLVSLSVATTQGPLGGEWIPQGPNQFKLALSLPPIGDLPTDLRVSSFQVGITNHTASIVDELAKAFNAGGIGTGKTVRLSGIEDYYISPGVIHIPPGITLDFGREALVGRQSQNLGSGQTPIPATQGGQIILLGGSGGTAADAAYITLDGPLSSLMRVSVYDPDQITSLSAPIAKPFFVRAVGYGCTISNLELVNVARGIDVRGGRTAVRDISGNPLIQGIRVDGGFDVPRIRDVHFVPSFTGFGTALGDWVRANATAFEFGCNDFILASAIFCFRYNIGLKLTAGAAVTGHAAGSYGVVDDLSDFDECNYAVWDECTQETGMTLRCGFTAGTGDTTGDVGYWARPGKTGRTIIRGAKFWSISPVYARISAGSVAIENCDFGPNQPVNQIVVDGAATIRIIGNNFEAAASSGVDINVTNTGSFGLIRGNTASGTGAPAAIVNASPNIQANDASSNRGTLFLLSSLAIPANVNTLLTWNQAESTDGSGVSPLPAGCVVTAAGTYTVRASVFLQAAIGTAVEVGVTVNGVGKRVLALRKQDSASNVYIGATPIIAPAGATINLSVLTSAASTVAGGQPNTFLEVSNI